MSESRVRFSQLLPAAFAVSLGSFLAFKVMAFYVMPVSLLLGVLLACHPLGVLLAARDRNQDPRRPARLLGWVLCLTALGFLFIPRLMGDSFDLPRKTGSGGALAIYLISTGLVLAPFFTASGAVEYAVLRAAADDHGDRRHRAYAALLCTTLLGVLIGYALLPIVGVLSIFGIALGCALFAGGGRGAAIAVACLTLSLAPISAVSPGIDAAVVRAITPRSDNTATAAIARGDYLLLSGWGKYAYVDLLAHKGPAGGVSGAYNGSMYWSTGSRVEVLTGDRQYPLDATVIELLDLSRAYQPLDTPPRFAIIGAGGGKQVQVALAEGAKLAIDAYELEPRVIDYFTRINPAANDGVYLRPLVRALAREGRAGVRASGPYDAIYLADAGNFFNYYRTALDFVFFLHTREAYRDYQQALSSRGFVAALVMNNLDFGVTQRIVNVLSSLGMASAITASPQFTLVVAAPAERFALIEARLASITARRGLPTPHRGVSETSMENPVPTDDRGSVYLFSLYPLRTLRQFVGGTAIAIGFTALALVMRARRRPSATLDGSKRLQLLWLGVNFVFLENAFITQLARITLNVSDAVIIGTALFLLAAAVGAAFADRLLRHRGSGVAVVLALSLGCFAAVKLNAPTPYLLAVELALFGASGALFPSVLRSCTAEETPPAFAIDSIGAALGTCLLFFVPALYGVTAMILASFASTAAIGVWIMLSRAGSPPNELRRSD